MKPYILICDKCGLLFSSEQKKEGERCTCKYNGILRIRGDSAMCEANSNAVLAEVRADVEQMYNLFINTVSEKEYPEHYKAFIYYYKKIKKLASISANNDYLKICS